MTATELYDVGTVVALVVSAGVAAFVFPLWRRYRQLFLLVFGFSALFDIFTLLFGAVVQTLPDREYDAASTVFYVLQIIGLLIYGAGVVLLARFVRAVGIGKRASAPDAAPTV